MRPAGLGLSAYCGKSGYVVEGPAKFIGCHHLRPDMQEHRGRGTATANHDAAGSQRGGGMSARRCWPLFWAHLAVLRGSHCVLLDLMLLPSLAV